MERGNAKMKKKRRILITFLLSVSINVIGCTEKNTVRDMKTEKGINGEKATKNGVQMEIEKDELVKSQLEKEDIDRTLYGDELVYKDIILTRQTQKNKVCITVWPSILREYSCYYYIPDDKEQEWLKQYMDTMLTERIPYDGKWKGMKEKGWQIIYEDKCFSAFEGGYLKDSYLDENGKVMEYFVEAPKLCDYIQIMLQEKLDYKQFQPANIKNVVSAKLDVRSRATKKEFYSQTTTDEETLKLFEEWFSHGEYIFGGAECKNQDVCLELTMANGEVVYLSVATDSCSNFGINGIYYDYRPTPVWDNREFFEQFDKIPWD